MVKDVLKVDMKLKADKDDKPYIELKDSEFVVRVEGCDKNSNEKALEIVNAHGVVLFQLIRKSSAEVVINGIFPIGKSLLLAGPDGFYTRPTMEQINHFRLKPIFKYPAWKYPGQYVAE
jgi:hypothetical protein